MVMERAGWLWRRKPSDKSPGGSDNSVSVSAHSEQCSDNQEILRPISDNSSPCHGQMPGRSNESQKSGVTKSSNGKPAVGANLNDCTSQNGMLQVSSSDKDEDVKETMKNWNDKLSAALSTIRAKEELVEQHAKITEEAVAGWEQAQAEVTTLKGLLEASSQKNAALEDQVSQLDKALKECVRQLRLAQKNKRRRSITYVEVVLRHFHRNCYESCPLWFLVGEGLGVSVSGSGCTW